VIRIRACRKGLFAGQAAFGRCVSKTEWVYGFKPFSLTKCFPTFTGISVGLVY
jgi:hypothetical protein